MERPGALRKECAGAARPCDPQRACNGIHDETRKLIAGCQLAEFRRCKPCLMPEGDAGLEGLEIAGMAAIVLVIVDARLDRPLGSEIMLVGLDPQVDADRHRPSRRDQRSPVEHGFRGIHEVEVRGVANLRAVFVPRSPAKIESPVCVCPSSPLCLNGTYPCPSHRRLGARPELVGLRAAPSAHVAETPVCLGR